MEGMAHKGTHLDYVSVTPTGYDPAREYPVIVLVHGFGASMYDLAGLAPAFGESGYVFLCPNGPIPLDIGGGQLGFAWTTPGGFNDETEAQRAEDAFGAFLEEVSEPYKLRPGKALLIGFSQGGSLSYHYGLTHTETFAGVAILSSSLSHADRLSERLPTLRTQPIFIGHGQQDPVVPVERGREASAQLEEWGYNSVYHEFEGMAHEINDAELSELTPWVSRILPPYTSGIILP